MIKFHYLCPILPIYVWLLLNNSSKRKLWSKTNHSTISDFRHQMWVVIQRNFIFYYFITFLFSERLVENGSEQLVVKYWYKEACGAYIFVKNGVCLVEI